MTARTSQRNPHIAGRALGGAYGFFGREDIFQLVETELSSPDQNAVVLFGQRRIGKTSILLQLQRRLPTLPFLLIYFNLMDRARRPLGQVLFEIASTVAAEAGMPTVEAERFDDDGLYFRQEFLPALYRTIGEERRPVLLLDEFDVLDIAAEGQLPATAAARAFFPYLRQLMEGEPRLGFVFVVGRRAEDLSIDVKATFKGARYKRVSVLSAQSARELVTTAQRQETLRFTAAAIDTILALTAGHPYFIQLLCQILWDSAYATDPQGTPTIDVPDVESTVPKALEAGENVFEWIWDGLPPAERVIFAAIAEVTNQQTVVTMDQLTPLLQSRGVRILVRELELAPSTLVEWEMLRAVNGGYRFFFDLMRRWVADRKPLPKVKDELDRIVPLADTLYQGGDGFYRQSDLENARNQLLQALRINPNHLKARLLLGQVMLEQDKLDDAVRELEEAYRYDEDAARYPLIRTLLAQGENFERVGQDEAALLVYERVLEISPREKVAQEHYSTIWIERGDNALKGDDLPTALEAYRKAGARDKVAEIEALQRQRDEEQVIAAARDYERQEAWEQAITIYRRLAEQDPEVQRWPEELARIAAEKRNRELDQLVAEARQYERQEAWDKATEVYQHLMNLDPTSKQWPDALQRFQTEQRLSRLYTEGLGALEQNNWLQAQHSFAGVVRDRPGYKDAADFLAIAVNNIKGQGRSRSFFERYRLFVRYWRSLTTAMLMMLLIVLLLVSWGASSVTGSIVLTRANETATVGMANANSTATMALNNVNQTATMALISADQTKTALTLAMNQTATAAIPTITPSVTPTAAIPTIALLVTPIPTPRPTPRPLALPSPTSRPTP